MEIVKSWTRAQAPTPENGKVTRFHDSENGGILTLKLPDGSFVEVGAGGGNTISFPNEANLTTGDIGKMLMSATEGLVPTQTEPYSVNGEVKGGTIVQKT
jgi:hypothetical protein